MNKLIICLFIIVTLGSCSSHSKCETNINVKIVDGFSYIYDLSTQSCTINFLNQQSKIIHFKLTQDDIKKISDTYCYLNIKKMPFVSNQKEKILIKDKCKTLPYIFTTIFIQSKTKLQVFEIDLNCKDYYNSNYAKKMKSFNDAIFEILNSKPEIKNAPKSNIIYM